MSWIEDLVEVITNNLFSQVAVLIGIIAIIGLALQRKPFEQVIAGGLRATIGVVVLNIGVEIFVGGLTAFQAIVASALGLDPPAAGAPLTEFSPDRARWFRSSSPVASSCTSYSSACSGRPDSCTSPATSCTG
jgi:ascorbate-specific PTS system EIIC-type component UlaA